MKPLKTGKFETIKEIQLRGMTDCMITFSKRGTLLGIYDLAFNQVSIYDSRDIVLCMHYIETKKYLYNFCIENESFKA